jgi:uncharacterized protein
MPWHDHSYISLETVRKSGAKVAAPVWFAEHEGKLVVWTQANSGKVKRIRNQTAVRVAPCDSRGALKGDWVNGTARLIEDPAGVAQVSGLLRKRFGLAKRLFELMGKLRGAVYTGIEITLT